VRKHTPMPNQTSNNEHGVSVPAKESAAGDSLVTKKVVAGAASVSVRCVEYWMKGGLIPWISISPRCVRFHLPSVIAALRRLEVKEVK
jgi:hypothetical protein